MVIQIHTPSPPPSIPGAAAWVLTKEWVDSRSNRHTSLPSISKSRCFWHTLCMTTHQQKHTHSKKFRPDNNKKSLQSAPTYQQPLQQPSQLSQSSDRYKTITQSLRNSFFFFYTPFHNLLLRHFDTALLCFCQKRNNNRRQNKAYFNDYLMAKIMLAKQIITRNSMLM